MCDWFLLECGRFWWWIQQDSNFPTTVLVLITAWYASLTYKLAKTSRAQLDAFLQPNLILAFTVFAADPRPGETQAEVRVTFNIDNEGAYPAKLISISVRVEKFTYPLKGYEGTVISPGHGIGTRVAGSKTLPAPVRPEWHDGQHIYDTELTVTATALTDDARHEYTLRKYNKPDYHSTKTHRLLKRGSFLFPSSWR